MAMQLNPADFSEVASPFMQQTHLEEINMLNELYRLFDKVRSGQQPPELAAKIKAIVTHTHAHFEQENAAMLSHNFPPYPIHKQVHDQHLAELDAVVEKWQRNGDTSPLIIFFEETTPQWMKQHISTMDFVTANYLAMNQKQI